MDDRSEKMSSGETTEGTITRYQIYGDNILECERALNFIAESLGGSNVRVEWRSSPLYMPLYFAIDQNKTLFEAQLFPGYGRWAHDIQKHLRQLGASLREATDAIVFEITESDKGMKISVPLLAFEFCGALPAGNNAWQRCGRALACAEAKVPYLYFAELGGAELSADREEKSSRLPNPLIPFAYLSLGQAMGSVSIPVFSPSPSISAEVAKLFSHSFGEEETKTLVKALLTKSTNATAAMEKLKKKAVLTTHVLSSKRKQVDTLRGQEWVDLANLPRGREKAEWLIKRKMPWGKKAYIAAQTRTFPKLVRAAIKAGAVAAGSSSIPFCMLPPTSRAKFAKAVNQLYGEKISPEFSQWLEKGGEPLVITWIAGFKPRGDDSRPDRGLVPFAHMLFGREGIQYLSVIYGPAKVSTWEAFENDPISLAKTNGLWESIVSLSDAILIDSKTARDLKSIAVLTPQMPPEKPDGSTLTSTQPGNPRFGEHDVDTVLHTLFSNSSELGVFEGMCNPPGGDWSGVSFQSSKEGEIMRWTSLPRVSGKNTKRPDHVAIIYGPPLTLMSIESKDTPASVESGIGPRLNAYVTRLLSIVPNISRKIIDLEWRAYHGAPIDPARTMLSAAAFRYDGVPQMRQVFKRSRVDLVLAFEFLGDNGKTLLHIAGKPQSAVIIPKISELCQRFSGRLEVQVHTL